MAFIYTVFVSSTFNDLREERRAVRDGLLKVGCLPVGMEDFLSATDEGFDQVDAELLVETILEDESEDTRVICYMYHADGMTLSEIGKAIGLSVSGVRKRLEAFRKRARLKLGEDSK